MYLRTVEFIKERIFKRSVKCFSTVFIFYNILPLVFENPAGLNYQILFMYANLDVISTRYNDFIGLVIVILGKSNNSI